MKIGFVVDDTLDTSDGVQQYILTLGAWLTGQGHDVHYLTVGSSRQDINQVHSLGKQLRIRFNRNVVPLTLPASSRELARLLDKEQFDVLHVQLPHSPAFADRIISLASQSTAVVGTFHILPYAKKEKILTKALGYWVKPRLARFDAVMSVSQPAQAFARESFGLESVVVPNPVDTASFRLADSLSKHDPVRIIFIGRLVERKGCEHLIRALAKLEMPFEATIVGKGPDRAKLTRLVESLKLNESVRFAGFVEEKEKRKLLSESDLAIYPAIGGESFGIVLIEAMAAGSCLVLAGDNPGYASVMRTVPEAVFKPSDHQQLGSIITELASNKAAADKLYKAEQALVKQFDIETVGPQVLDVYQTAIAKHSSRGHTKD